MNKYYTSDRKKYLLEYQKNNYKRIPLDVPFTLYDDIKNYALYNDESINGFIKRIIKEYIDNHPID